MTRRTRIPELLRTLPTFSRLTLEELELIAADCRWIVLDKNQACG